uniref:Metallo-beta-lactamase domain-containing protein n=1 Tax=Panagrolaimus sp. JU765 TaxID=591449 RepID=A0AC34Q1Z4_9BILA
MTRFIFRQLFEPVSCTYSYLLGCASSKKAVIIDPVLETVNRDSRLIDELGLELIYGLNTHIHADHVTGTGELKKRFPNMKSVISERAGHVHVDLVVKNMDRISFGNGVLEARSTPGHTNGCVTYVDHQNRMAFTGDALLIHGCGRTDLQHGDARTLYESVHDQIFSLPDDYLVYPAHDYSGKFVTSVGEEKLHNPRLTLKEDQFVELMNNLNLTHPHQFEKSLAANEVCGIFELMDENTKKLVFGK